VGGNNKILIDKEMSKEKPTRREELIVTGRLADTIKEFWGRQGYAVSVRVVCGDEGIFQIVSNLANGLPLGYAGTEVARDKLSRKLRKRV
jgi:hypothetical protein